MQEGMTDQTSEGMNDHASVDDICRYQYWLAADKQQEQLEALQEQCEEELLQVTQNMQFP